MGIIRIDSSTALSTSSVPPEIYNCMLFLIKLLLFMSSTELRSLHILSIFVLPMTLNEEDTDILT